MHDLPPQLFTGLAAALAGVMLVVVVVRVRQGRVRPALTSGVVGGLGAMLVGINLSIWPAGEQVVAVVAGLGLGLGLGVAAALMDRAQRRRDERRARQRQERERRVAELRPPEE